MVSFPDRNERTSERGKVGLIEIEAARSDLSLFEHCGLQGWLAGQLVLICDDSQNLR